MDLSSERRPLDAPGVPEIDGELASRIGSDGRVQVEVIEHLRVRVPAAARQAWLEAEQASWEPWLRSQKGFLGRELRWDREREEGQLLIRWASRELWHAIPRDEIEAVQERFEEQAHRALRRLGVALPPDQAPGADPSEPTPPGPSAGDRAVNPFPLLLSEELPPEALP